MVKIVNHLYIALVAVAFFSTGCAEASAPAKLVEQANRPADVVLLVESSGKALLKTAENEDPKFSIRSYPLGKVKSISITDMKYFDADRRFCRNAEPSDNLSERHVRYFLKNAEPISDTSLANYYHEWGECYSGDVIVTFQDGRSISISFSDEGATAYISPIVNGKQKDAFPYICRPCGGETFKQ